RSVDSSGDFGPRGLSVQYTQDVRQHTQDVRGCPCVSVCPSAHAGRPSVHTGRPSANKGRPSAHAGRTYVSTRRTSRTANTQARPWLSVSVAFRQNNRTSVTAHAGKSVSTQRTSVAVSVCVRCPQCKKEVRRPLEHARKPWLSVCVRQYTYSACLAIHVDWIRVMIRGTDTLDSIVNHNMIRDAGPFPWYVSRGTDPVHVSV
ncbi:hypothetical protein IGI04_043120, partial [Brassica rapa subsp. trilocularis]